MTSSIVYPYYHHYHYTHQPPLPIQQLQPLPPPPPLLPPSRKFASRQSRAHEFPVHSRLCFRTRQPYHVRYSNPAAYHSPRKMATSDMSELEQMQRMSENYNPNLPGPMIGSKLPMNNLVTEYAQADPAFVVKTQALAATHSAYRSIKGDGQCGWRGTVFGYFELLLQLGDIQLILQEETRLQSFGDTMKMAGIDYDILVDMFDYTWELFADLKRAVEGQDKNENVLLESLNSEDKSDSIVYHFKLNPDNYEPFLEMPIADYRFSRIEPTNQEIDQIGLQALTDAVIAQAGFALDVLYLDRSVGAEVTPHEFAPKNTGGPTIRLLYRPGHYDMIYKGGQQIQVFFQKDNLTTTPMYLADPSNLHADFHEYVFPGSTGNAAMSSSSTYDRDSNSGRRHRHHQHSHHHHSQQQRQAPFFFSGEDTFMVQPQHHSTAGYGSFVHSPSYPQQTSSPCLSTNTTTTATSPHTPTSATSASQNMLLPPTSLSATTLGMNGNNRTPSTSTDNGPAIRLTQYVKQYERIGESVPLCTSTNGNAASLSTAHFRNQEFQPQMWRVEDEYSKH